MELLQNSLQRFHRQEQMASSCTSWGFRLDVRKKPLQQKSCQALEHAALGSMAESLSLEVFKDEQM